MAVSIIGNSAPKTYDVPAAREGGSRAEHTDTRMPNTGGYVNPHASDTELRREGYSPSDIKSMKQAGKVECESCKSRTYVDGSGDPGVSFKTPTKLSPAQAATAVAGHENEHVSRNAAKAARENKHVYSSVRIFTSVCHECGKSYVSGGETRTVTRKKAETQDFFDKYAEKNLTKSTGKNLDTQVG